MALAPEKAQRKAQTRNTPGPGGLSPLAPAIFREVGGEDRAEGGGKQDVYQLPQAGECCPPFPNPEEGCSPGTSSNMAVSTSLLVPPLPNMQRNHMTQTPLCFQDQTLPLQSKDLWSVVAHTCG